MSRTLGRQKEQSGSQVVPGLLRCTSRRTLALKNVNQLFLPSVFLSVDLHQEYLSYLELPWPSKSFYTAGNLPQMQSDLY